MPRQRFLGYEYIELDRQQTVRLAEAARSLDMTVNDLLLADMFTTLDDQRKTNNQRRDQPLRIMVPVYVRSRAQQDIPASNGIGDGTTLTTTPVLTGTSASVTLDVDITGTQLLDLLVGDGGNGNGNDHGDWADAQLQCS